MSSLVYDELTIPELLFIANGCGPKFFGWLIPDRIFESACMIHDFDYWVGCTKSDRYIADLKFKKNMNDLASEQESWRWYWRVRARVFYAAVRIIGGPAFYYGEDKRNKDDLIAEMSYAN